MIVILTQDLMMSSSVSTVAKNHGLGVKSATSVDRVVNLNSESPISILLIDLQLPKIDLPGLLEQLRTATIHPFPRLIAYAQHVNVDLLSAARNCGIDQVLTRGQLHANLEALLSVGP